MMEGLSAGKFNCHGRKNFDLIKADAEAPLQFVAFVDGSAGSLEMSTWGIYWRGASAARVHDVKFSWQIVHGNSCLARCF